MLFDRDHNLFMLISTLVIVITLVCFKLFVKDQKRKDMFLKVSAILTVIIHFSSLYVDYFSNGEAYVESVMLLPIYPCNVIMWLLVIVAFFKDKNSKIFNILAEITFYIGITGGVIGIALNENYSNTPDLRDWDILKGLISHATMLLGCIYLLVGNYIKIRVSNLKSIIIGLCGLLIDGYLMIAIYKHFQMDPPNTMFLLESPLPQVKWVNTWFIGILAIIVGFIITATYEQIALDKEDRWYNKIRLNKINNNEKELEDKKEQY